MHGKSPRAFTWLKQAMMQQEIYLTLHGQFTLQYTVLLRMDSVLKSFLHRKQWGCSHYTFRLSFVFRTDWIHQEEICDERNV